MTTQRKSTRQRLVQAAQHLFATQGVTETTTRQIADLAEVNEVTLFRNFGSKQGLLLAVIEEAAVFTQPGSVWETPAGQFADFTSALQAYAQGQLRSLDQIAEFLRSLVGEAGHYPVENRVAIGRGLTQIHQQTVQYLTTVLAQFPEARSGLSAQQLASLINPLLLGYAVIELTTEFHQLWANREEFIANVANLFVRASGGEFAAPTASLAQGELSRIVPSPEVRDLAPLLVRQILEAARKSGPQDYALTYVLFGAGLSPSELLGLQRSQVLADSDQQVLQVTQGSYRQVPLNQWILGHRYGSYRKNPLTQWLRSRKDQQPALWINETGQPMSEPELQQRWRRITAEIITPSGQPPTLGQAQQTWRVEMLMRGISLEDLSLLSGCEPEQLAPYGRRAREQAALEQAIRLDQRPGKTENPEGG